MTETTYTEERAMREEMERICEAVVITSGYDMEIGDYVTAMEDEGPEVYVEAGRFPLGLYGDEEGTVPATIIREVDAEGYIDAGEPLAVVVGFDDYDKLGRE